MKISFLGDSITQGCGATAYKNCYVALLGEKYGFEAKNYGIGGTRISKQKEKSENEIYDKDFIGRVDGIDEDSEFVFVFGGTNDQGHGKAPFGVISDNTPYTFCGAINYISDMLTKKFGKDKICFILPLKRFNGEKPNANGKGLGDYVAVMTEILKNKGIDFIDLYHGGFQEPKTDKGDEFTADGLHPNDNGHLYIANKVAEYLKAKGII